MKNEKEMKIICLVASPRGARGNTARLAGLVLEGAESQGAKVEIVYLPGRTVLPCKGCDTCHRKGGCPQRDDFESIKGKILASDGLVLASPNYISSVSAQMKAFMDRCCGIIHCMAFEGKYGASVVTSGGGGDEEPIADYLTRFLITTGIRPVGSVWAAMGVTHGEDIHPDIKSKALELGKKLVQSRQTNAASPEIEKKMKEFQDRMRSLILYRKEEWPYEYGYWEKYRRLT
jgi:multimeric flavodoxin WrbA